MRDELTPAILAGLGDQVCDVGLDRLRGNVQPLGYLGVGQTSRDEQEDVHLPAGDAEPAHLDRDRRVAAANSRYRLAGAAQQAAAGGCEALIAGCLELGGGGAKPAGGFSPPVFDGVSGDEPVGEVESYQQRFSRRVGVPVESYLGLAGEDAGGSGDESGEIPS